MNDTNESVRKKNGGRAKRENVSGQAMLEAFLVILIICILLFGLLQTAIVFTGSEILHHAAARAARAKSVGFNDWMALKAVRVASIPNSGEMIFPGFAPTGAASPFVGANPGEAWDLAFSDNVGVSERAIFERALIPFYMGADNSGLAQNLMNYVEWENGSFAVSEQGSMFGGGTVRYKVTQDFPLEMPFARFVLPFARRDFEGKGRITLSGESEAGEHSTLYLE